MGLEDVLDEKLNDINGRGMRNSLYKKFDKYLIIGDLHEPFMDYKSLVPILKSCKDLKPNYIILNGDIIDFYTISKFDKDPRRAGKIQEDIDKTKETLRTIRKVNPKSKIFYNEGNHEERMERYLKRNQGLYGLKALKIPELLDLKSLNIEYIECKDNGFELEELVIKHGDYANKYASNKELDVEMTNGISGHTHRNQSINKTGRFRQFSWHNHGHLSDPSKIDYTVKGTTNWQQGFAILFYNNKTKRFFVDLINIKNHSFIYNNKLYKYG